jgi:hypothetical protein
MMISYLSQSYSCRGVFYISAIFSFPLQREKNSVCCWAWPMRQVDRLYLHFFFSCTAKPVFKTRSLTSFLVRVHSTSQKREDEKFPEREKEMFTDQKIRRSVQAFHSRLGFI